MPATRVVLDTNVFVSALLGKGPPSRLYGEFIAGTFELVCSKALLSELAEVLIRPELAIPSVEIKTLFRLLRHRALLVRSIRPINACRDPADNMPLECAVFGNAEWIVSGDKDLLILHPFHGVKIVSPADFLKHLSA